MFGRVFISKHFMSTTGSGDPIAKAFFNPRVQQTLKSLTGLNYEKIFRVSKTGQKLDPPSYQFMTDKELRQAKEEIRVKALKMLQMPPVMSERKEEVKVLEHDPALVGFDSARYVFTDITFGIHDRDRIIVVRESGGTLRSASWSERDRMNQTYFPTSGRKFKPSSIFDLENLKEILGTEKYLYVLDKNCVQFEPDHPNYIETAQYVYDFIDTMGHYEVLHSTRHYGPMVFYLVWEKKADNLIIHYLKKLQLAEACKVVQLFASIHSDSRIKQVTDLENETNQIDLIRSYIKGESRKETMLHATLESMIETLKRNRNISKELMQ